MPQDIHDNTEDEHFHFTFINNYLQSKASRLSTSKTSASRLAAPPPALRRASRTFKADMAQRAI
jgi:hypothetical protein